MDVIPAVVLGSAADPEALGMWRSLHIRSRNHFARTFCALAGKAGHGSFLTPTTVTMLLTALAPVLLEYETRVFAHVFEGGAPLPTLFMNKLALGVFEPLLDEDIASADTLRQHMPCVVSFNMDPSVIIPCRDALLFLLSVVANQLYQANVSRDSYKSACAKTFGGRGDAQLLLAGTSAFDDAGYALASSVLAEATKTRNASDPMIAQIATAVAIKQVVAADKASAKAAEQADKAAVKVSGTNKKRKRPTGFNSGAGACIGDAESTGFTDGMDEHDVDPSMWQPQDINTNTILTTYDV